LDRVGRTGLWMAGVAVLLAACGTAPKTAAPTPAPGGGKYYLDDGPPDRIPENLGSIPDATPADEPFHRFANRPYTVFGQTYVPVANKEPRKERGLASWYGRKFHGQKTSSGEVYDMFAMSAAHKTLPIPSYVRVTNVKNGKSVVVRVNDRGPFHGDRVIDLSYAAAARIGIVNAGSALVEVERVLPGATEAASSPDIAPPGSVVPQPATIETPVLAQEAAGHWLQLGAFSSLDGAESFRRKVARETSWLLEPLQIASRDGLHRVRAGPYRNRDEATAIAEKLRESLGFVPVLTPR
jgi:rare lipoprotein A